MQEKFKMKEGYKQEWTVHNEEYKLEQQDYNKEYEQEQEEQNKQFIEFCMKLMNLSINKTKSQQQHQEKEQQNEFHHGMIPCPPTKSTFQDDVNCISLKTGS